LNKKGLPEWRLAHLIPATATLTTDATTHHSKKETRKHTALRIDSIVEPEILSLRACFRLFYLQKLIAF
jgi:hypothetical protein